MRLLFTFLSVFAVALGSIVWAGTNVLLNKLAVGPDNWVRMAQVRLLPKDVRNATVREYVRHLPALSEALILGDSQTYGIDLKPSDSLGARLRESLGPSVFNMSVVDGRYTDQLNILEILMSEKKRFRLIIINIDPAHYKKGIDDPVHIPKYGWRSLRLSLFLTSSPGIYAPFRTIPQIGLPIVRNEESSVHTLDLYSEHRWVYPHFLLERQQRDYYEDLDGAAAEKLVEVLQAATSISDAVMAFASPTSYELYNSEKYGWNWDTGPVINIALKRCRTVNRAICIDLSKSIAHEHFMDVIHLRASGQKFLAEELIRALRRHQYSVSAPRLIPEKPASLVIPPFLKRPESRDYAAKASFCFGVMPPMAMLGRS